MDPRPRGAIGLLERPDFMVALQSLHHLVQPLQQSLAPARVDVEAQRLAFWRRDGLRLQIDRDFSRALCRLDLGGEIFSGLLVDDDGQDAILEAVGEENVAEARTND